MVTIFLCAISSTSLIVFLLALSCPSPMTTITRRGSIGSPFTSFRLVQAIQIASYSAAPPPGLILRTRSMSFSESCVVLTATSASVL